MVISSFVAGLVGVLSVGNRADRLDEIGAEHAVVTTAALEVYRALAAADATSLNVMLVSGDAEPVQQQAFRDDIAAATAALESATRTAPTGVTAQKLSELTDAIPVYVELVEAGWIYAKQAKPLGTSYLTEATAFVRGTMLTAATAVRDAETKASTEAQDEVDDFPWVATLACVLAVAVLAYCQRYVARRTRRRFNIGMVAATVLTVAAFGWLAVASTVAASHSADALDETRQLISPVADARAQGRSADGDEARSLIFPQLGDHERLSKALDDIGELVRKAQDSPAGKAQAETLTEARKSLTSWRDAHTSFEGKGAVTYGEAAAAITQPSANEKQTFAAGLDDALGKVATTASEDVRMSIKDSRSALAGVAGVLVVLMVLAAAATVAGLWPRISEYR
ncbi:hypothetical protein AB5J62_14245 [Amycolatopsis sp. cg5]|uniref:hypothetical protein n=1 Tax=Amycolatopsis sp. cg5 TaxID=3238802 RepID=UPI003524B581